MVLWATSQYGTVLYGFKLDIVIWNTAACLEQRFMAGLELPDLDKRFVN